jgi:hypothetical protein
MHRAEDLPSLKGSPKIGTPLPNYILDPGDVSRSSPLAAARRVGWKYPVVDGAAPGLATLVEKAGTLAYTGINHGISAERLIDAAILADDNLRSTVDEFEPRILEIPALRLYALWLYGVQSFFVVLADGGRPGPGPLQLERDIGPHVAAALRARRIRSTSAAAGRPYQQTTGGRDVRLPIVVLAALALVTPFASIWVEAFANRPVWLWVSELIWIAGLFVMIGISLNGYWFGLLVDGRNKIALSRLQMLLWTILFAGTLFVVYAWNIQHAKPDEMANALTLVVPTTAWLLMGMAGVSAAGSPAILSAKSPPDPAGPPPPAPADRTKFLDGMVVKRRAGESPRWSDIVLGDEAGNADVIDISKIQQLFLSIIAVVVYAYAIGQTIASAKDIVAKLPAMDGGFLALIGASHATYLVYKGVSHSN